MEIFAGFLLYTASFVAATLFVAPYLTPLVALFSFAGVAAVAIVGGIASFPVLIVVLAAAHNFNVKARIPESE